MRRLLAATLAFIFVSAAQRADTAEQVDLELVLLADASGSIDAEEVQFQRQGYAAAITDPARIERYSCPSRSSGRTSCSR